MDFRQLMVLILRKLGKKPPIGTELADLLFSFEEVLVEVRGRGKKTLLVIDEAQNLAPDVLESVRLLMNLAQPGPQALQLVLSGQLGLADTLALPELRQFKQRIRVEYRLVHLNREEVIEYINHRLATAGREAPLFDKGALAKIFELSAGVPRVVNHLADKSMLAAYVDGARTVSARHVEGDDVTVTVHPMPAPPIEKHDHNKDEPIQQAEDDTNRQAGGASSAYAHRRSTGRQQQSRQPIRWLMTLLVLLLVATGWVMRSSWLPYLQGGQVVSSVERVDDVVPTSGPESKPNIKPEVNQESKPDVDPIALPQAKSDSVVSEHILTPALAPQNTEGTSDESIDRAVASSNALEAGFVIHVASFTTEQRAETFQSRIALEGFAVFSRVITTPDGHLWHRVYVGAFASRAEAEAAVKVMTNKELISYSLIVQLPFG